VLHCCSILSFYILLQLNTCNGRLWWSYNIGVQQSSTLYFVYKYGGHSDFIENHVEPIQNCKAIIVIILEANNKKKTVWNGKCWKQIGKGYLWTLNIQLFVYDSTRQVQVNPQIKID